MAEDKKTPKKTTNGIRVRTAQAGFRRGGRAWSDVTEVLTSEFTAAQLKQIRAEKRLVVEDIDIVIDADSAE